MREIKFKFIYNHSVGFVTKIYTLDQLMKDRIEDICDVHTSMSLEAKLQYTGLKDKNGSEIYEGDIVKNLSWMEKYYNIVEYKEGIDISDNEDYGSNNLCGFCLFDPIESMESYRYSHFDDIEEFKIIGNIYENPNLLTK